MSQYTIQDAQQQLQQLLKDAQQGQTVFIMDDDNRLVQLVPVTHTTTTTSQKRQAGSARGQIHMADDFDEYDE